MYVFAGLRGIFYLITKVFEYSLLPTRLASKTCEGDNNKALLNMEYIITSQIQLLDMTSKENDHVGIR